jgi:hypothetical protein
MASTYSQIATQTLGSSATTVTFSSIPQTYTNLVLIIDGTSSVQMDLNFRFNSDTGSNYSRTYLLGTGSSTASGRDSNGTSLPIGSLNTSQSNCIINFNQYSNTTTYKTVLERANQAQSVVNTIVGLWRSTSAISSITITAGGGNILTGSVFSLYGIKGA